MTYDESNTLMSNVPFRGRIKVAALKYSTYILNEPSNTPAHSSRLRWAQQTAQAPDQIASGLQPQVTMDDAVQAAGIDSTDGDSMISDTDLQTAVETTVNKLL